MFRTLFLFLPCLMAVNVCAELPEKSKLKEEKVLYTMGTSNRSKGDFIRLLKINNIRTVVDVRTKPYSRNRQFNRDTMKDYLKDSGVDYVYLGGPLGGLVEGGFEKHRGTEKYGEGLKELEKFAGKSPSVIICAEYNPLKCHRLKVGEDMEKRGWRVVHIIGEDFSGCTDAVKKRFQ